MTKAKKKKRAPKNSKASLDSQIAVRFSSAQREDIEQAAEIEGIDVATFIRSAVMLKVWKIKRFE